MKVIAVTRKRRRERVFWVCQATLVALVAGAGWRAVARENGRPRLPTLLDRPRVVRPLYDDARIVSDAQLATVLRKLHPRTETEQPLKINHVDHALRMWGTSAEFDDGAMSGQQMLDVLLRHSAFVDRWGSATPPLLRITSEGLVVTTQQGRASVSHVDHLMGTLAEIGVPLSYRVQTASQESVVREILVHALQTFSLNQREYEWTALAATLYASDGNAWYSREGQAITFAALARRLMRQRQPQGVCYGNHRLYTLAVMLRVDTEMRARGEHPGLLSDTDREAILAYLKATTRRLYHNQAMAGYWDGNWPDADRTVPDPQTAELSRRVLATGHVLEWWALAPMEVHPPRETIVRAGQWLAVVISEMDDATVAENFTFLTHAARALALWRGCFPDEFERQMRKRVAYNSRLSHNTFMTPGQ